MDLKGKRVIDMVDIVLVILIIGMMVSGFAFLFFILYDITFNNKREEFKQMNKKIYITNGMARCGKDTFAKYLNEIVPTLKYSSIDKVKDIAELCGWNRKSKTEKDRKFLSDLKMLTTEYSNMPFNAIKEKVEEFFLDTEKSVMLIDIREPEEIEKAKNAFGAKTILIKNERVKSINSNFGDSNVFNYKYDFVIDNNGTLDEFKNKIHDFYNKEIL